MTGRNGRQTQPLIDTHTHLGDQAFDADRSEVLARAKAAGVELVFLVSETLDDAHRNFEIATEIASENSSEIASDLDASRALSRVACLAGLYPTHLDEEQAEQLEHLIRERRAELVGIGEVGLDRWVVKDEGDRELQRKIFARFIDLAIELDLPLNVHSRSAGAYAIDLLLERGATKVQLHAFDGKASKAQPAVEAGYYFSVPPSVVRSQQKQKLVDRLPLDRLLLETDSPVLGAATVERNEPANIRIALTEVARIKGVSEGEVAERVLQNTQALYGDLGV